MISQKFLFLFVTAKVKSESEVAQLCPALCDPVDCSRPGSSIRGILQARILEWVAISFCRQMLYHLSHNVCLQCRRPGFDPWVGKISWRREWQPTPVFLPGESHGWRGLVGYSPQGRKESDVTERLHFTSLDNYFIYKWIILSSKDSRDWMD